MADRVHPRDSPPPPPRTTRDRESEVDEEKGLAPPQQQHGKSLSLSFPPGRAPAPGTYVVQLPKDQILRYPPPPSRLPYRARNPRRRSRCCCCCLSLIIILITLVVLTAIFAGVIYFVYNPKAPKYTIDKLSIQGFNLSSSPSSTYSPQMDVTVRAQNPNAKIGIYYVKGSSVSVSHSGIGDLCTGVLPVFYQPTKNVTIFNTTLNDTGSMMLSTENYQTIRDEQRKKQIPLRVNMHIPVKIKFGAIKTWTITVKVHCSITVDSLAKDASILSDRTKCSVDVNPWG